MTSSTLRNALMTWVDANQPTRNLEYTTRSGLRTGTPGTCISYLYFSRPFPLGSVIKSARVVFVTDPVTSTGPQTITFKRLKQAVSLTKVTNNTKPTALYTDAPKTVTKTGPLPAGTSWTVDVTTQLQAVANGDPWYGWQITGTMPAVAYIYNAKWPDDTLRPRLEVTWAQKPSTPDNPSPAGGRSVGNPTPWLHCDYTDIGLDNDLVAIQVQRNPTNVWTAPVWDSGTVTSVSTTLQTELTSWPPLTTGQSVWWRMRVLDENGTWSAYSVPAQFSYDDLGTVTINNPAVAPNNFVTEATPPITWTFTGETQRAYQINIQEPDTGKVLWTSGKITGTATSFTLPPKVLKVVGDVYRVRVIVWDTDNREAIPSSTAWTDAQVDFTFALSSATAPVTGLTLTPADPRPKTTLTWSRATAPDSFTVLRDSKVIATGLQPGDVFLSGTSYRWADVAPVPNQPATYQVLAVVNGKASSGNVTATITNPIQGIWIADYDRSNEIVLVRRDDRSFTYGEDSEVLNVLGSTQSTVVTHAQRGIEGTVSGELHSSILGTTTTAVAWRDALLRIRRKPGQVCWLTVADRTIPVVLYNWRVSPKPVPQITFSVAVDFVEVEDPR